jgi:flavin-dependent dehydrogenase
MDRELEGYRRSGEGPGPVGHEEYAGRTGAVIGTAGLGHGDYGGIGDRSFALLGDAAGLADPATGEGIENALRSAELLAEAYRSDGHFGSYPSRVRSLLEPEFRVARVVRNVLFDHGVGAFLIRKGMTRDWAYALVSAIADAVNEHDPSVVRLLRRGVGAYRRVRDEPDGAARGSRFGALAPGA